jgi:hypothetical protein
MKKKLSILALIIYSILITSALSVIAEDIEREDEINDVLDANLKEVSRPNVDILKISCEQDGDEVELKLQLVSDGKIQDSEFFAYTIILTTNLKEYSLIYNNGECLIEDEELNEIEVKSCTGVGTNTLKVTFDLSSITEECTDLSAYTMEFSLTAYYMDTYPNEDIEFLDVDAGGPYSGDVNKPVQFSGDAEGDTTGYEWFWEFGDGESSEERNPTHTYEESGTYEVSLIVSDPETGKAGFDNSTVIISGSGGNNHQSNGNGQSNNENSGSSLTIFIALIVVIVIIGVIVLVFVIKR